MRPPDRPGVPRTSGDATTPAVPSGRRPPEALTALGAAGMTWPDWPESAADGLRPAAVLVLLGVLDDVPAHHAAGSVPADLDVLMVGRSRSLRHHPGQVSFPGGRVDATDTGPEQAAVREAVEETGLDPAGVQLLGTLGSLPLTVSRHLVTPVLAWWAAPSPVAVVDHAESATVFRAPVADLVDPALRRSVVVRRGRAVSRTPAFLVGDHVVWGFTAFVLDRLLDRLGWAEPWDRSQEIPVPR